MGGTAGVGKEAEAEVARGELGGRLAGLSIPRQVGVLALWPFLEQLLGFMVGFVDLLISTRLPEVCGGKLVVLDAMAVGGYVGWFLMILQYGMATGVSALVSRATGRRDGEMLRAAVGQGLVAGLLAGVVAMGVGLGMIPVLMSWFELSGVVRELAETYIRIMAWLCIPSGVMVCLSAALRGFGDTRTPFVAMVVVNVVNVFASWVLGFGGLEAFGFNGGEPMGVAGLAWGTVIGWAVGLVLLVGLVWWKGRGVAGDELGVRLEVEKMRPEGVEEDFQGGAAAVCGSDGDVVDSFGGGEDGQWACGGGGCWGDGGAHFGDSDGVVEFFARLCDWGGGGDFGGAVFGSGCSREGDASGAGVLVCGLGFYGGLGGFVCGAA